MNLRPRIVKLYAYTQLLVINGELGHQAVISIEKRNNHSHIGGSQIISIKSI